jgi:hypothetical protein
MRLGFVLAGCGLLLALAIPAGAADDCDRACLRALLDQYLVAVTKHDPAAAPLFPGFRQTENAVVRRLGTGLWQTATGLGRLQRRVFVSVNGHAPLLGLKNQSDIDYIV